MTQDPSRDPASLTDREWTQLTGLRARNETRFVPSRLPLRATSWHQSTIIDADGAFFAQAAGPVERDAIIVAVNRTALAPDPLWPTLSHDQQQATLRCMEEHAGGFVSTLAEAWFRADHNNREILGHAFDHIVRAYQPAQWGGV